MPDHQLELETKTHLTNHSLRSESSGSYASVNPASTSSGSSYASVRQGKDVTLSTDGEVENKISPRSGSYRPDGGESHVAAFGRGQSAGISNLRASYTGTISRVSSSVDSSALEVTAGVTAVSTDTTMPMPATTFQVHTGEDPQMAHDDSSNGTVSSTGYAIIQPHSPKRREAILDDNRLARPTGPGTCNHSPDDNHADTGTLSSTGYVSIYLPDSVRRETLAERNQDAATGEVSVLDGRAAQHVNQEAETENRTKKSKCIRTSLVAGFVGMVFIALFFFVNKFFYCMILCKDEDSVTEKCPRFTPPLNSVLRKDVRGEIGDSHTIQCEKGFVIVGNATMTCRANKTWSGAPRCLPDTEKWFGSVNILDDEIKVPVGGKVSLTANVECLPVYQTLSVIKQTRTSQETLYSVTSDFDISLTHNNVRFNVDVNTVDRDVVKMRITMEIDGFGCLDAGLYKFAITPGDKFFHNQSVYDEVNIEAFDISTDKPVMYFPTTSVGVNETFEVGCSAGIGLDGTGSPAGRLTLQAELVVSNKSIEIPYTRSNDMVSNCKLVTTARYNVLANVSLNGASFKCVVEMVDRPAEFKVSNISTLNVITEIAQRPTLKASYEVIEGRETRPDRPFICEAKISDPESHLDIYSDLSGSYDLLHSTNDASLTSSYGRILTYADGGGYHRLRFVLGNLSMAHHRSRIWCVNVPDQDGYAPSRSEGLAVEIVQDDFCTGKSSEYLLHPYNCKDRVHCDVINGNVLQVPAGCNEDQCVDMAGNCHFCSQVGSCQRTDLYIERRDRPINVGDHVVLSCLAKGVKASDNIRIIKGDNTTLAAPSSNVVASLAHRISESLTYPESSVGLLRLTIDGIRCTDGGTYTCEVVGGSTDSVSLIVQEDGLQC